MAFSEEIQKQLNDLLVLFVKAKDSISLDKLLANDFMPDKQVDLIKIAADIGGDSDDRDQVLAVLLRNGVK
jgi:hypothetical protein